MALADRLARPPAWWGSVALILVLAGLVAGIGTTTLPLEGHEALVVQTAEEMHARGDYIVPYFNAEPRLVKPPLSYWLTGATAGLFGDPDHIEPWHGRLPSILAGLGLVGLAITLGRLWYDRATGLCAGLMLGTSAGFFAYTHNARPDLLYAFWCAAGYTAFAHAWQATPGGLAGRLWAYAMWGGYGLATLTKGPQLPLMLLLACALYAGLCGPGWRRGLRTLRPLAGVPILCALTLPWWLMLRHRLGATGLYGSQLSGTLLIPEWRAVLDPYYLYRPLQLVLPWALMVVPAVLFVRRSGRDGAAAWLVCIVLVPALCLSFGVQRRWFYMLPVLPALCVLLGAGTARWLGEGPPARNWRAWFVALHGLLILGALAWLLTSGDPATEHGPIALCLALCVPLFLWVSARRIRDRGTWLGDMSVVAVMAAVVFIGLGATRLLWSQDRFDRPRLAEAAARGASPDTPFLSLAIDPNVFVYYTGRHIHWARTLRGFTRALSQAPQGEARAIVLSRDLDKLSRCCEVQVLDHMPGDRDEATSVVALRLRGAAAVSVPQLIP
ncbi:MAG: ArnT family glycosyltransferase [Gammaproteobacteria bacterium]